MEGKSLGQVAYESRWCGTRNPEMNRWECADDITQSIYRNVAAAVVAAHEERKAKEIQCVRCGKAFQDRSDMLLHIAEDH